jgi:predicted GH43/DUF377 family glycosyl hydrolase
LRRRRSSAVLIAATLVIPIALSSLSLFSHIGLSQSGSWTDSFDDEFKIAQKSNVVISGGDVSLGASSMNWFRQGMVIDVGPIPSTYENSGWPSVVKGSDGVYRMWYTSTQAAVPVQNRYIRYATSIDGKNWDLMGIVIGPNATREDRVYAAAVIEDGGVYKMWYVGDDRDPPWGSYIFYATSPDGYTWTRQGLVLPKAFEGTYDDAGASFPSVLKDGGVYKMWYSGYDDVHYRILYATSPDGQSWTYQNLAIDIGSTPGDYDYIYALEPAVMKDVNGMYHMWYSGNNGTHVCILNATSPDGATWTKQGLSLDVLPDSQEDVGVLSGTVIMLPSSVVTMWYEGVDSSGRSRIFRATLGGSGHVVSEAIGPHPGCDWSDFFANKTDRNADIFVSFSVLDAVDWTTISGYWNLTDVQFSLLSIDPLVHPTIRLRADLWNLQGNFTLTPELHDWTITWTDPNPPPPDKTPPEILDVLLDGDPGLLVIEGTLSVTLTGTVDDSTTGGSIVGGANATSPAAAWWNSTPMNPDDILDTSTEDFSLTIDTSALSQGLYDFCVYGWDSVPNNNSTGGCVALTVLPAFIDLEPSPIGVYFAGFPLEFMFRGVMWTPFTPGLHNICMFADSSFNVSEIDELNNIACSEIEISPGGPLTNLSIGQPNYTSDHTFITSASSLTLEAVELSGIPLAYTEYRIDGANWQFYVSPFTIPDEGFHMLEYRSANTIGWVEPIKGSMIVVDNSPPESTIQIGDPHYFSNVKWIRSTTPLSIESNDRQLSQSIVNEVDNIPVYQENITDSESIEEYLARSNHTVTRDIWPGLSSVTFLAEGDGACPDIDLGVFLDVNDDGQRQVSELVDYDADADQIESVYIENPQAGSYIITIAGFTVTSPGGCLATLDIIQTFGGSSSSGIDSSQYRLWNGGQWSEWLDYSTSFHATIEGLTYVEYYASDNLGNSETVHNLTVHVDDTPPHSMAGLSYRTDGGYDALITFNDNGCGVSASFYHTNNESWRSTILSQIGFTYIAPGNYTVEFYAIDNLGNVENVKSVVFEIAGETPLPTVNWKPLVALVFTIILTIVGLLMSKRRPWKGDEDKRAVLMSFIVFSMPFVLTEAMTGLLSHLTGLLSIPPVNGLGTLVDIIILAAGLLLAFARLLGVHPVDRTIKSDSPDSTQ